MRIRILYHDNCFDGAASAAVLSRFLKEHFFHDAEFRYAGLSHAAFYRLDDSLLDGAQNAIVDFRYSSHSRLTWWFDHHQSAFLTAADEDHYRRDRSGRKILDTTFKSCARLIATHASKKYAYSAPDLNELVHWADIIDGAQYESLEQAVEMRSAAAKLTLVIENADSTTVEHVVRRMQAASLGEILAEAKIRPLFARFYENHLRSTDVIRQAGRLHDGVVLLDLTATGLERFNKFLPYFLFPGSVYCVALTRGADWAKISLGSNPWAKNAWHHNLAGIAERYGGGGHPAVAGINFKGGSGEQALRAALDIAEELMGEGSSATATIKDKQ